MAKPTKTSPFILADTNTVQKQS